MAVPSAVVWAAVCSSCLPLSNLRCSLESANSQADSRPAIFLYTGHDTGAGLPGPKPKIRLAMGLGWGLICCWQTDSCIQAGQAPAPLSPPHHVLAEEGWQAASW